MSVPWVGNYTNEHLKSILNGNGEAPHIICRADNSPFFLNLNYGDVGHTLVIGPTGAGKSTLLSTLGVYWLKYPGTRVIFFDKDASCYNACLNAGGTFIDISDDPQSLKLNPFGILGDSQNPSKAEQVFVSQLIADHLVHRNIPVSPKDQSAIFDAVQYLSSAEPELRGWKAFRNQVQDPEIRAAIEPFIHGEYSHLFRDGLDEITPTNWLTFEMGHLMQKGKPIVSFVLEYLFHRVGALMDGTPTLLIIDESWIFLDNEIFVAKLREDLKTYRKKNCYIILATQEIQDAHGSAIFSTINNACYTKILLPNHQARQKENSALYTELGLSSGDIFTLNESKPKRDYFFFSPYGKQRFSLELTSQELELIKPRVAKEQL
jgi:type IV secretion system protein VirB4